MKLSFFTRILLIVARYKFHVCSFCFPCFVFAQQVQDSIVLKGAVRHGLTGVDVVDARLVVRSRDGEFRQEVSVTDHSSSPDLFHIYHFQTKVPKAGTYVVQFVGEGFGQDSMVVHIPERKYGRRVKEWTAKDFLLYPSRTQEVGEAVVRASRVMIVNRGDTIIYNASAFKLASGSMLDALIAQLPGVTLDDNGNITVNGQHVNTLLLNGKDFFRGETHLALKNLPSYVVKNIKFYQRERTDTYLSAARKRTPDDPWVLDVHLKKEYNQGWLGNFSVAVGTKDRYQARACGIYFSGNVRWVVYGSSNNLNSIAEANTRGSWNGRTAAGDTKSHVVGTSVLIDDPVKRTTFEASASVSKVIDQQESFSNKTLYYTNGNIFSRMAQNQRNDALIAKGKVRYGFQKENSYLTNEAVVSYHKSDATAHLRQADFLTRPDETAWGAVLDSIYATTPSLRLRQILNSGLETLRQSDMKQWTLGYRFATNFKSPLNGEAFTLNMKIDYGNTKTDRLSFYRTLTGLQAAEEMQRQDQPSHDFRWRTNLRHDLFRVGKTIFQASYDYNYQYTSDKRAIFFPDSTVSTNVWGNAIVWDNSLQNGSYRTQFWNKEHIAKAEVFYRLNNNFMVQLNFPFVWRNDRIVDVRDGISQALSRHYFSFEPSVYMTLAKGLDVRYQLTSAKPSMANMLNVTDASQPLLVVQGNPQLQRTMRHFFHLIYHIPTGKARTRLYYQIYYNIHRNMVSQGMSYDRATGITAIRPYNVNGNWDFATSLNYTQVLDKRNRWTLNAIAIGAWRNSVEMMNDGLSAQPYRSSVRNFSPELSVKGTYRKDFTEVTLRTRVSWQHLTSPRSDFETVDARTVSLSGNLQYRLPLAVVLRTNLTLYMRRGYALSAMNTNDLVWNVSLSRALDKAQRWTLEAEGFDLLHQLSNVSTTMNAQGFTETWVNSLPNYFLLRLSYQFNSKPKKR